MGAMTFIQWCWGTFSPWRGCFKISPGCANCYAEALGRRQPGKFGEWGIGRPRILTAESGWAKVRGWNDRAAREKCRRSVFFSLGDPFEISDVPVVTEDGYQLIKTDAGWLTINPALINEDPVRLDDVRLRFFELMAYTPYLDWLLLTKRPENIEPIVRRLQSTLAPHDPVSIYLDGIINRSAKPPRNLAIGVSAENQEQWNLRIPKLLGLNTLNKFVSVEPMLESINFRLWNPKTPKSEGEWMASVEGVGVTGKFRGGPSGIRQIIFGGESGLHARPCSIDWIRDGLEQCRNGGVLPFVKQLGAKPTGGFAGEWTRVGAMLVPTGVRLKDSKGGDPAEWPEDLRIRETFLVTNTDPYLLPEVE